MTRKPTQSSSGVNPMKPHDVLQIRQKMQLTQEQFAKAVGVSFVTVNRWENGHTKPSRLAVGQIERLLEKEN
jgi:DNA-binding transcriptional regulator YiaG